MATNQQEITRPQQAAVTRREEQMQQYFVPPVDTSETPDGLILRYDMPGVRKENADITVDKGTLIVTGKVDPEESGTPVYRETRIGDYRREFTLPNDVDAGHISAEMNAGVLTVRINKPEEAKPKRIQIQGS
ncbi:MAG TPA: Hsp20/alpha crystallin family protein [Sedimentisphaerales bacterium]|nr:Hsp20/alpha crystallin family protein [Sedimentisphaerales bacterium]HRS11418.1 Hsp20/alpha crystallin family protein [Sedimentisphaerales bacterium]HRV48044.1 Hsp20/alpha crystallin family protein [Sedimentisphaerales bacterium]